MEICTICESKWYKCMKIGQLSDLHNVTILVLTK